MAALADDRLPDAQGRRIRNEAATPEADWAAWLGVLQPPELAIDDLLAANRRLVVVSPHPDDEVLACGGLLALLAGRDVAITIVAVTDGEASHRGDPAWPAAKLAEARRGERSRGLAQLGLGDARAVHALALPDSRVAEQTAALALALHEHLRPGDCVVSTWHLDGHPDHDAVGATTLRICAELGCALLEAPVWMWQWSAPGDVRVPWHRLRALPLPAAVQARKAAALAEHRTQLAVREAEPPVLGAAILQRAAREAEYFLV